MKKEAFWLGGALLATLPWLATAKAPAFPPKALEALLGQVGIVAHQGVNYRLESWHVAADGDWLVVRVKPKRVE